MCEVADFVSKMLRWYDGNARKLPWRIPPASAERADPYAVWLSEIMLQQTQVATVIPYFTAFLRRWPDICALASAKDSDVMGAWAGLGYYSRARNLLKCARVVCNDHGGVFPADEAALRALPGIGPYTAAAIAAIAFGQAATVVDGNIERVMARVMAVTTPLPAAKPALRAHAARLTPPRRAGDYAQALMDLGATVCTPRAPDCAACPVRGCCRAYDTGLEAELPRRQAKPAKPTRIGAVYLARRHDGAILLETRPPRGLLAGMQALPSTDWTEAAPPDAPPLRALWQPTPMPVRHVFTHFNLILTVFVAQVDDDRSPERGSFVLRADPQELPSVMRKALQNGLAHLCDIAEA